MALPDDLRLPRLNHWAWLFAQLGLAPAHPAGAYGNLSCRSEADSFLITRAGMAPAADFIPDNFCQIQGFDQADSSFLYAGKHPPSSESYLHYRLYQALPATAAIFHGHCPLFHEFASALDIPETAAFHPYGTRELAESALTLVAECRPHFFLLREHGFVALGDDVDTAGRLTLDWLGRLLKLL